MAERSRRATAGVSSKGGANSALAQLKELRKSGKKHADVYEIKAEDAVFDVLDDDEYSKLVSKRRNEAGRGARGLSPYSTRHQDGTGGFVVGDNGLGYEDVGEECDWGENTYEKDDADDSPPARKGGKKGGKAPAGVQHDGTCSTVHTCCHPQTKSALQNPTSPTSGVPCSACLLRQPKPAHPHL